MLPSIVRRHLYQRGWEQVTYKDLLESGPGNMVTCELAMAVLGRATRITWGLPPGEELSKEDEARIRTCHEELLRTVSAALENAREAAADQPDPTMKKRVVARFHRRDGLPDVPFWQMIDGRWFCGAGVPADFFAYVPQHLCERLVSLGKSRFEGGEEEWIEYTSVTDEGERKFVRVDLVLESNGSITVELLENRVERGDAVVWWRHWRV